MSELLPAAGIELHAPEGAHWEFLVLFAVVIFGPVVVQRAKVPGIIGLLLGGFLIGPHGLDLISQGNTTVPELGKLGLLYLMFVAGVELDLNILRVHRRSAIVFGLATFSFPMLFGSIVGFALGWSAPAALLLGSLVASHTLLLYPVVREARITNDPAIASGIGATVLTDTIALVILAAISGTETGSGSTQVIVLQLVVGLAVLGAFTMLGLPRLAALVFRKLGTDRGVRYLTAIVAFLAAATVAETFGIEGIVGAFFAGLALNRLVPNEGPLMDRIDFVGGAVFIPVFMVSVGLLLEPAVMFEPETLGYAGLFIFACLGGKAVAAQLMRPVLGFTRAQAGALFGLSSPQAAATLAAVIVGFNIGLFSEQVVNASLVVILVSIVIATIVMERSKGGVARPSAEREPLGTRVLVVLEDTAQAPAAFALAARIAEPDGGAVQAMLARPAGGDPVDPAELERIRVAAVKAGTEVEVRPLVHSQSAPVEAVLNAASAENASLVLAGDRRGDAATASGTWGESVAATSPAPVCLLRGDAVPRGTPRLSSEPDARGATGVAGELAARLDHREPAAEADLAPASLKPGELGIFPAAGWDMLGGLGEPAAGASALIVLEPVWAPDGAQSSVEPSARR